MLLHLHPLVAVSMWQRLRRLGGPGLLLLGIADNSVIPLTGSMDVLTIWLAARHREPWPYYAIMATLGAIIGGYITYSLARKGGKKAMERKLSEKRTAQFCSAFERWGFSAVAIPAMMPPPFPFVPFLLAAGALQYSRKKFLAALTLGRSLRYGVLAYLGVVYGRHFLRFFNRYTKPTIYALVAMSVIAGILALVTYLRYRNRAENASRPAMTASQQ